MFSIPTVHATKGCEASIVYMERLRISEV